MVVKARRATAVCTVVVVVRVAARASICLIDSNPGGVSVFVFVFVGCVAGLIERGGEWCFVVGAIGVGFGHWGDWMGREGGRAWLALDEGVGIFAG